MAFHIGFRPRVHPEPLHASFQSIHVEIRIVIHEKIPVVVILYSFLYSFLVPMKKEIHKLVRERAIIIRRAPGEQPIARSHHVSEIVHILSGDATKHRLLLPYLSRFFIQLAC